MEIRTNFSQLIEEIDFPGSDTGYHPFATRDDEGNYSAGGIVISLLNEKYGMYSTAKEMINASEDIGMQLYFKYLVEQGILEMYKEEEQEA